MASRAYTYLYSRYIIKGRWPQEQSSIAKENFFTKHTEKQIMSPSPKFKQGDIVTYDSQEVKGKGKIVGVSMIPEIIFGTTYIIEDMSNNIPNKTYPYSHFTVKEIFISKEIS